MTTNTPQGDQPRRSWAATVLVTAAVVATGAWLGNAGDLLALPVFTLTFIIWVVGLTVFAIRRIVIDLVIPIARPGGRLARVFWNALPSDPDGIRMQAALLRFAHRGQRFLPVGRWIVNRFRPARGGLATTVGVLVGSISAVALWRISTLLNQPTSAVALTDLGIADLVQHIYTEPGRRLMVSVTEAGRTVVLTTIVAILLVGATAARAWRATAIIFAITASSALGVTILKAVNGRTRPAFGALVEPSLSWPSGHASAGLSLALAIVVAWWATDHQHWPIVAGAVLPVGLLIGYSRAYLAVHWASDVIGGWLLAIAVTGLVVALNDLIPGQHVRSGRNRSLGLSMFIAAAIFVAAAVGGLSQTFPKPVVTAPTVITSSNPMDALEGFAPFSETLTGRTMEPIGVIIATTGTRLEEAAYQAGWSIADPPTLQHLAEAYWAGARRIDDLTAPVTPTFFNRAMQNLAIEKPVDVTSARVTQRHHARFWRLPITLSNGCSVWVGTTSLDDRVEWTWRTVLPNHHINPAIDLEQAFLVAELTQTGLLARTGTMTVTPPTMGTNAAGNAWFTDGTATILTDPHECGS